MKWTENGIQFEASVKEFAEVYALLHPAQTPLRKGKEVTVIGHAGDEHKFTSYRDAASYLSIATQRNIRSCDISHRKGNGVIFVKDFMPCNKEWDPSQTPDTELANIPQGE